MKTKDILAILLLGIIFSIGFLLRIWDFGVHPAGLNQDEASIAVEAASLYSFGADRNGQSYPVHFISWGSGQNTLYAYLLLPFVPLGMTPSVIRFPMLFTGLISIVLIYLIGRKIFSPLTGVFAASLLAISPWHVMLSRWALESNILPFIFMLGFLCVIRFDRGWQWLSAGCVFLGLSLYAYGTAYLLVPLFLLWSFGIILMRRRYPWWQLGICLLLFLLVAFPIGLFVAVNSFSLADLHIGPISIPRLPADPRYEVLTGVAHGGSTLAFYVMNAYALVRLLFFQTDGFIYNSLPKSGLLFPGAILFALFGMGRILQNWKNARSPQLLMFLGWVGLALLIGMVQPPVVNRINVLFPCLILLVAWAFEGLWHNSKAIFWSVAVGLVMFTTLFARDYFKTEYREEAGRAFAEGFIPALQRIPAQSDIPVCVITPINMPYIFVLLVHPEDPSVIAQKIHYVTQRDAFRVVDQYGNYYFDLSSCPSTFRKYIIAKHGQEVISNTLANYYFVEEYGYFDLYVPMDIWEENQYRE